MCECTSVEDDLTQPPKKDEVVCGLFPSFSDLTKYGEVIWWGHEHWGEERRKNCELFAACLVYSHHTQFVYF